MDKKYLSMAVGALLAGGMIASCSSKDEPVPEEKEMGKLAFTIDFGAIASRAEGGNGGNSTPELPSGGSNGSSPTEAVSRAIPSTSWDNIQNLQLFLYDRNGVIYFSDYIDAAKIRATLQANPTETGKVTYTYSNVPSGFYHLTAIANVNNSEQRISTRIEGVETKWDAQNVIGHYIYNLRVEHKPDAFPIFYTNQVQASGVIRNERPFAEPSEVFMGQGVQPGGTTADGIEVVAGRTTTANVSLKREVSMMRLRVNLAGDADHTNNADVNQNPAGMVDFSRNSVVMLFTLPECILPMAAEMNVNGVKYIPGTSNHSVQSSVLVTNPVDGGTHPFYQQNPTSGYSNNGQIIGIEGDPFNATAWRDIIVFPNDKNRQLTTDADILKQNRYLLVISARGLVGHITKNGPLTEERPVYWVGYINEPFSPNTIREVNVTFRDGGTEDLPERPDNVGNLVVNVTAPEAWDSNIQASKIEL